MIQPLQARKLSQTLIDFRQIGEIVWAGSSSRRFLAVSIMFLLVAVSSVASRAGDVWGLEVGGLFTASIFACSVVPYLSAAAQWSRFLGRARARKRKRLRTVV